MTSAEQRVVFRLDEQKYAVTLTAVERVISAVEITALPEAPDIVAGIINLHGQVIPVISVRRRLGLTECALELSSQFLIVRSSSRTLALIVDGVEGVVEASPVDVVQAKAIFPGIGLVEGVLRLADGLILIVDLDKFLSMPAEKTLEQALQGREQSPTAEPSRS